MIRPSAGLSARFGRVDHPRTNWPAHAETLFAVGTIAAVISLLCLGGNFAVFPALRKVTVKGPYSWIRHPAYAGESLMVLACYLAGPGGITSAAVAAYIPLLVLRIHVEERTLRQTKEYADYIAKVRWRLAPGIW